MALSSSHSTFSGTSKLNFFLASLLSVSYTHLAGLNTAFIGILEERGVWTEKCAACGECVLHLYGGICPITRCAKKMMNGPCSGSREDRCEVSPDRPCAWQLIYKLSLIHI